MRVPLIVLIVIFAVSVLGLSLVPGEDARGRPDRMGIFDAFYFMSYTATTIGFGELPHAFTAAQRMWVTVTIFLAVIGWAYAIGSLLSLMQDQGFRQALAGGASPRRCVGCASRSCCWSATATPRRCWPGRWTTWVAGSWSSTTRTPGCRPSSSTPTAPTRPRCWGTPGTPG